MAGAEEQLARGGGKVPAKGPLAWSRGFLSNDEVLLETPVWKLLFSRVMRRIKLTGREASVVRAIGFTESMLGTEIQDTSLLETEDVTDTLNALMSAGFVQCIPFREQVEMAEVPVTSFELNPAYVHELREALIRR